MDGEAVHFKSPDDARREGIETVYQNLALSPALSIADNMFLGREIRKEGIMGTVFRQMDQRKMQDFARDKLSELGLMTIQNINQAVETLSGGQRQGVAGGPCGGVWIKSDHPGRANRGARSQGVPPRFGTHP